MNSIGSTIKRLRTEREMTLKQMAEGAGMSVSYMSDIERGRTSPSLHALRQIGQSLDVDVKTIFQADELLIDESEWLLLEAWRNHDMRQLLRIIAERWDFKENNHA